MAAARLATSLAKACIAEVRGVLASPLFRPQRLDRIETPLRDNRLIETSRQAPTLNSMSFR